MFRKHGVYPYVINFVTVKITKFVILLLEPVPIMNVTLDLVELHVILYAELSPLNKNLDTLVKVTVTAETNNDRHAME